MNQEKKLIRAAYLYVAALVSLIFLAIGSGNLIDTGLKYYVFPKAEKGGYHRCNQQPQVYGLEKGMYTKIASNDQKSQLENLLRDYNQWQKENSGEECYSQERQKEIVSALAMIIVSLPIFLFHWNVIRREKKEGEC